VGWRQTPIIVGLLVAWGGTALLVSPAAQFLGDPSSLLVSVLGQVALWLLCAAVIGIVLFWERKPLESLWLRPWQWQSIAWAGVLVVASISLLFPATEWVRKGLGLPGYAAGMQAALVHPVWFLVFAALTAGVVEEVLFRGYAVTRLAQLTGSLWWAVGASSAVFAALHLPVWGAGPSLAFFIGGLATTMFFVWRRDLIAMIIAHAAIDTWGLVIAPAFSRWWT
jgi:membrane protease YdiL (CAAX protease family)